MYKTLVKYRDSDTNKSFQTMIVYSETPLLDCAAYFLHEEVRKTLKKNIGKVTVCHRLLSSCGVIG